jgi:single-strand DNA-binding protein
MFNKVILLGNLVRDPELRYTPNGHAVANITVATNRKSGEYQETFFGYVQVWGKQAENVNQYLAKGDRVLVEGRLKTETYEKEGRPHSSTRIIAENVRFLPKKKPDTAGVGNGYNDGYNDESII